MTMQNDPIVEDTRAARRELHKEFAGDRAAFLKYLKEIEAQNAERLVKLEPRSAVQVARRVS
jgi:hypothetical protein